MSKRLNKKIVRNMLIEKSWAVYVAAKALQVSHEAVYKYLRKYPDLKAEKDAFDQETVDFAEITLRSQVLNGEGWAVKFVLATKGRDRGYVTQTELTGKDDLPIKIIIERETRVDPLAEVDHE